MRARRREAHMNTSPLVADGECHTSGIAEALYFDSGGKKLFAWLHAAPGKSRAPIGLVICKPFGYEAICSHRAIRTFAEAAAAIGLPALRFDYLGTGDSADIETGANQLETWTRDVVAAVAELRRRTGVRRVCLLGFRLGALIAMLAADKCVAELAGLICIAPIINGRRYLRELRTTRLASMLTAEPPRSPYQPSDASLRDSESVEVSGFILSASTIKALSEIDDNNSRGAPVPQMLVIDGVSLPAAREWRESLSVNGTTVQYRTMPGLVQMLMTAPQFAEVPKEMIAATCVWLSGLSSLPEITSDAGHAMFARNAASTNELVLGDPTSSESKVQVTERPVFFGSNAILFGIVTEPWPDEKRRRAVILLNAGADYHIGANRMYVALARRWARRGYVVLRMDLGGIGDSGTLPGRPDEEVFPPTAPGDVQAAIDFLRARYSATDITLAGLCSGAYHALRAAVSGALVNRILMINPQNFFWKPGKTVNDMQVAEVVQNPLLYRSRAFSGKSWKKLVTGQLNLRYIAKIYASRMFMALESHVRDVARRLHIRLPHDLGWDLQGVAARGVKVVFVFAQGEPGISLLRIQAGSSIHRIGAHCRVHIVEGGDHVFSKSGPRSALEKVLDEELFAINPWKHKIWQETGQGSAPYEDAR
jgi:alpha-beta hydrolase superfamily lysophospholipase